MDQFTRLLGGSSQVEATKQAYDQQRAYAQAQNVPKELGFLDRIVGLRGGLDELHERLCAFGGRVGVGNPAVTHSRCCARAAPRPPRRAGGGRGAATLVHAGAGRAQRGVLTMSGWWAFAIVTAILLGLLAYFGWAMWQMTFRG